MSEKKSIIKVGFWKYKEPHFKVSPEERRAGHDRLLEKYKELGIKVLVPFCYCYWSSEEWDFFQVEEYPDIEALQEFEKFLWELGHSANDESRTYLGTYMDIEEYLSYVSKHR